MAFDGGGWRLSDSGPKRASSENPKTVLIVEDSAAQRALLRRSLEQANYRVLEAASAQEAQDLALKTSPDAVLLGWDLPDSDGPEVLRRWKAHGELQWIPVLMLTSHTEPEKIHEALECGAVDFLRKPPDDIELHARIRSAVRVKALQDELRFLASRDPLTGLLNRRALMERLNQELVRCRRYSHDLSVAIIDLDHFKAVNDAHGHDIGDLVLTQIAAYLQRGLREVDTVTRFGGEEFVALLPDTSLRRARDTLNRLRRNAAGESWGNVAHPVKLTFSAGLTCFVPALGDEPDFLIKSADTALYQAKDMGRDRVEIALPQRGQGTKSGAPLGGDRPSLGAVWTVDADDGQLEHLAEVIQTFLAECIEGIAQSRRQLDVLAQNPDDESALETLYLFVHTIKGTSGFLGFTNMEKACSVGEGILKRLRRAGLPVHLECVALFRQLVAVISDMAQAIRSGTGDHSDHYRELVDQLQDLRAGLEGEAAT